MRPHPSFAIQSVKDRADYRQFTDVYFRGEPAGRRLLGRSEFPLGSCGPQRASVGSPCASCSGVSDRRAQDLGQTPVNVSKRYSARKCKASLSAAKCAMSDAPNATPAEVPRGRRLSRTPGQPPESVGYDQYHDWNTKGLLKVSVRELMPPPGLRQQSPSRTVAAGASRAMSN